MKKGFTLLELLVASLLLSMLVSILSMVFSSSASAWRIGRAGVDGLHKVRQKLAVYEMAADNAYPWRQDGPGGSVEIFYIRPAWAVSGGQLVDASGKSVTGARGFSSSAQETFGSSVAGAVDSTKPIREFTGGSIRGNSVDNYIIGAGSAGPDRKWNTKDDIVTWPYQSGGSL